MTDGKVTSSFNIYRCFIFDTTLSSNGSSYHLCEGEWYCIDTDYLKHLKATIDPICEESDLIAYNHDTEKNGTFLYSEERYNRSASIKKNAVCLDQTNISPTNSTSVEPCDLLAFDKQNALCALYHIKISSRSSQLSHLFNQGINSLELLYLESESREKLKNLIKGEISDENELKLINYAIENKKYKVIFGIITKKDKKELSSNLPLFSRVSLARTIRALSLAKTQVALTFIADESVRKEGFTNSHFIEVIVKKCGKGKNGIFPIDGQGFSSEIKIKYCPTKLSESEVGKKFKIYVKCKKTMNFSMLIVVVLNVLNNNFCDFDHKYNLISWD